MQTGDGCNMEAPHSSLSARPGSSVFFCHCVLSMAVPCCVGRRRSQWSGLNAHLDGAAAQRR
jgi:hypothetical protein